MWTDVECYSEDFSFNFSKGDHRGRFGSVIVETVSGLVLTDLVFLHITFPCAHLPARDTSFLLWLTVTLIERCVK